MRKQFILRITIYSKNKILLLCLFLLPFSLLGAEEFLGTVDSQFSNAANWDSGALPGTGDDIEIKADCIFDLALSPLYGKLKLKDGSSFSFASGTEVLQIEKLESDNSGTLDMTIGGTVKLDQWGAGANHLTFLPGTGTIHFTGNHDFKQGFPVFNNVIIDVGTGKSIKLKENIALAGDLIIVSGTFKAHNHDLSIAGDWNNLGGIFDEDDQLVSFNGCGQTFSSTTAPDQFYNLTVSSCACVEFLTEVEILGTFSSETTGLCENISSAALTNFTGPDWSTKGNIIDDAVDFLGTVNDQNLKIRTNDTERMVITNSGEIQINVVPNDNSLEKVLVEDANGVIHYRDLSTMADGDFDPTNELQDWSNLPGIPTGFSDDVDDVNDADNDPENELQDWSTLPGIPSDIADGDQEGTDDQAISYDSGTNILSLEDGGNVNLNSLKDNLGNHKATQNVELRGNYLSNDGDSEGILINDAGMVGINTSPNSDTPLSLGSTGPDWMIFKNGVDNKWDISNSEGNDFVISEWGVSHRFTLKEGGNVGIGTLIPQAKLDVNGQAKIAGALTIGGFAPNESAQFFQGWDIYTNDNRFSISEGGVQERITIVDGGNVGFSTVSPQATVDVNGTLKVTDGTQGFGKVLTSDASGLASWETLSDNEVDPEVGDNAINKVPVWNGNQLVEGTITMNITTASGLNSSALGYGSNASGEYATAIGRSAIASGKAAFAAGFGTKATAHSAIALGHGSEANSTYSFAGGVLSLSSGIASTALGESTKAIGDHSFAGGKHSEAFGESSIAIGWSNEANNNSSVAIGHNNTANGLGSVAFGGNAESNGNWSSTSGLGNLADSYGETVVGLYNVPSGGNHSTFLHSEPVFVVGNGYDAGNRSNAMTILKNGKVGIGNSTPTEILHITGGSIRIENIQQESTSLCRALYVDDDGVVFYKDECSASLASNDDNTELLMDKIQNRDDRISELEARLDALAERMESLLIEKGEQHDRFDNVDQAWIKQNSPNPFQGDTAIDYYIPMNSKSAHVRFYDMRGRLFKTTDIREFGQGTLTLSGGNLHTGSYSYEFIVDGQRIATKKMVFAR